MTAGQLEARKAEIAGLIDSDGANLDALETEVRSINTELEARKATETKRAELRAAVSAGAGVVLKSFEKKGENNMEKRNYTAESAEYRSGFLKELLGKELTAEERSAVDFVMTTTDSTYGSGAVLPSTMVSRIWDNITEQHSIMGDITMYRTGTILDAVKRTAITQGDAAVVAEGEANDDEINTFVKVTLSGKDFSKHINISYAMAKMSLDAFEDYLVNEISERLGNAMANDVVAQILTDYDSENNAVVCDQGACVYSDITATFSKLHGAPKPVVYASQSTIYSLIYGMSDSNNRPIFQSSNKEGIDGYLCGAPVKVEDAVTGKRLLIGDPSAVVYNMVQDIMVENDRDIKTHTITYSGYARGEGALLKPKAFATFTFGANPL